MGAKYLDSIDVEQMAALWRMHHRWPSIVAAVVVAAGTMRMRPAMHAAVAAAPVAATASGGNCLVASQIAHWKIE